MNFSPLVRIRRDHFLLAFAILVTTFEMIKKEIEIKMNGSFDADFGQITTDPL